MESIVPRNAEARRLYAHRHYLENKEQVLARTRAYALAHPEVAQRSHRNRLLRDRRMSKEQYTERLKEQSNVCAICGQEDNNRLLAIDHNHACCIGEKSCGLCNRGLLCNRCNKKLAAIEDKKFLEAAIAYLTKWA
jgi:hypothetical protein